MEVEEEALTSLSTLDIVSIIIVLSLVFSTVPNWGKISSFLDPVLKSVSGSS